jgi:hypothetical protein
VLTLSRYVLHNILWANEACFTRQDVLNDHNSQLWARGNPYAIREHGYQVRCSVSVWAGIDEDIVVGPCLLSNRPTAQRYRDFLESVLAGPLEDVLIVVRQRLWFRSRRSSSALWGRRPAVVEHDISGEMDWTSRADCMASSLAGSNSDGFFSVRTPDRVRLFRPSRDYRRSRGGTSSSCDTDLCQHVKSCPR